jgi:MFS family permease
MILEALKSTWSLFLGMAFLMLGNGLQGTLISWRANYEGFEPSTTGLIMTSYYLGFFFGSLYTTRLINQVGYIRVFAALASLASTAVLIQIIFISPTVWLLMRLLSGFCCAGIYVVVESWLNARSDNQTRGQILSFYMFVSFAGLSGGQLLLKVADPTNFSLFLLTSILLSLSLIPILISRIKVPEIKENEGMSVRKLFKIAPAGVVCIAWNAIAQGSMFGMGAVYAANAGMDINQTALFMSSFIAVGAIFHWPLGWLSDKIDRRIVIVGASIISVIISVFLYFMDNQTLVFIITFGMLGAFVLPIYSLGVAHTNDRLKPSQMTHASSTIVLLYGIGSAIGPLSMGYILNELGNSYFFIYIGITNVLIAISVFYYMIQREAVPDEEQGDYQLVPSRITAVGMEAVAEEAEETIEQ